jgi:hypothetical protein
MHSFSIMDIENKKLLVLQYSNMDVVIHNAKILLKEFIFELEISQKKDFKYKIRGKFTNDKWVHFGKLYYEQPSGILKYYEDYTKNFNEKISKYGDMKFISILRYYEKKYIPSWFEYYLLYYRGDLENIPSLQELFNNFYKMTPFEHT